MGLFGNNDSLRDEIRKAAAWATTRPINGLAIGLHPADAAVDELGNVICLSHYGRHDSPYGWEIDHREASCLGGPDALSNLRALKCKANRSLGGILGSFMKS